MSDKELEQLKAEYKQLEKELADLKLIAANRQEFIDWVIEHYPDVVQEYLDKGIK